MSKHYVAFNDGVKVYEGSSPKEAKAKALRGMNRPYSHEWVAAELRRRRFVNYIDRLSERLP